MGVGEQVKYNKKHNRILVSKSRKYNKRSFNRKSSSQFIDNHFKRLKEERIGEYQDLPEYEKDNEYLITGYRINYNKWSSIFRSIIEWHNETINIWSHLLGAFFFATMAYLLNYTDPNTSKGPLYIQRICFTLTMLGSVIFHLGLPQSEWAYKNLQKLDHNGVILMISSSSNCFIEYMSPCQ